jgi:hypothetical protein
MYPVIGVLGMMLFTWAVAVWASLSESVNDESRGETMPRHRKAA